jgi:HEPN domain-containing protein
MTTMAEGMMRRALGRYSDAREALAHGRNDVSISNSIEAIECAAKAAFLLLAEEYPKRHEFRDEEFAALFDRIPDQAKHLNFPRLFVLYKLWMSFYTQAKYGNEKLNIAAADLFQRDETELALSHASAWANAAVVLAAQVGVCV